MYGVAVAPIAYTRLAPLSIHGSSKRFRELVTYSERTPISSVARVRKSYQQKSMILDFTSHCADCTLPTWPHFSVNIMMIRRKILASLILTRSQTFPRESQTDRKIHLQTPMHFS